MAILQRFHRDRPHPGGGVMTAAAYTLQLQALAYRLLSISRYHWGWEIFEINSINIKISDMRCIERHPSILQILTLNRLFEAAGTVVCESAPSGNGNHSAGCTGISKRLRKSQMAWRRSV